MERKQEVRPSQTEKGGHGHERVSEDSQILIGQAVFQRNAMPVNSGQLPLLPRFELAAVPPY